MTTTIYQPHLNEIDHNLQPTLYTDTIKLIPYNNIALFFAISMLFSCVLVKNTVARWPILYVTTFNNFETARDKCVRISREAGYAVSFVRSKTDNGEIVASYGRCNFAE